MPRYLGIDVATRFGWSVLLADEIGKVRREAGGSMDLNAMSDRLPRFMCDMIGRFALKMVERSRELGESTLVGLEDQYLDKNPNSLKVMSRIVGRFQQAFECLGVTPELVAAQTWQTAVLGRDIASRKRDVRKAWCVRWAAATFGVAMDADEADAAGLAYYLATRGRAGAKRGR